ncbi:MAG TPA: aldo/keto reductase [Armatimonadota bacterium]|nr:aldo/keto reductase [Armatimonadota bacterium]
MAIIGLGGYHMAKDADVELSTRIARTAVDEGVNFLDNAWCYNDGNSERFMGEALRDGYRDKVFLMTKNHGRDAATYHRQLDESLKRLQTDTIDLVQTHEIIEQGIVDRVLTEGVLEAAMDARQQGKIRYIGFTGHAWPHLFEQMLATGFVWDTVQMPVNVLDAHYRSFGQTILPILNERKIGAIGMKSLAGGQILKTDITAEEAINWSLSQPIDVLVSGWETVEQARANIEIARRFRPMRKKAQAALLERSAKWAGGGSLEGYKPEE